jgi:hypothetical protein
VVLALLARILSSLLLRAFLQLYRELQHHLLLTLAPCFCSGGSCWAWRSAVPT